MTPDRWQQVYDLFNEALPLAPRGSASVARGASAADPELRAEVERLLARDAQAEREDFLAPPHETTRDGLMMDRVQAVKIHCPNCGNGIELVDLMAVDQVDCPSCHSNCPHSAPGHHALEHAAGDEPDRPVRAGRGRRHRCVRHGLQGV